MDGLAPGCMIVAALTMAAVCVAVGRANTLELDLLYVPRSQEMTVFCTAMAGATLGFLWFNAPPAMVFMGDTGSLALGACLGAIAVAAKHEIVWAIIGATAIPVIPVL